MKRFTCALTLLAAVLAVLVLPAAAQAAEISFFRGKTAVVEFYETGPDGCSVTSITVFANESRSFNPPAPQEAEAWADITIHLFNSCTGEQRVCGTGSFVLPDGAFNVAGHLASATLNLAGEVYDICDGTNRPVTVALTWTGEGEIAAGRSHSSMHAPGYHVLYRQSGQYRDATAGGSMTVDGTPLSLDNGLGYLSRTANGTVTRIQ